MTNTDHEAWLAARLRVTAAGNTLATLVRTEADAGVELPQGIKLGLEIFEDRKREEDAAYEKLMVLPARPRNEELAELISKANAHE